MDNAANSYRRLYVRFEMVSDSGREGGQEGVAIPGGQGRSLDRDATGFLSREVIPKRSVS